MPDELGDLLDTAIYKEISSEALYEAAQKQTTDPGAQALMKELAQEEAKHSGLLKALKEKGLKRWHARKVRDLKISNYLTAADTLRGAGLEDTLMFAMKREQQSVEFYSNMMGSLVDRSAKRICQRLVSQELGHKLRLEVFYDGLFYKED